MTGLAVLGATGSIGTQTLAVASEFPERLKVVSLAARRDVAGLREQVRRFRPAACCLTDPEAAEQLRRQLAADGLATEVLSGRDGLAALAAARGTDTVVVAVAGAAALKATLAAIGAGKRVALASKEVLVAAGHLVMREVARTGAELLPVDSEHSAIFQCLQGEDRKAVRRILLTASGGPFWECTPPQLRSVTLADALAHPTWRMGNKITVDSATLMNKGLEVIEACWLFGVSVAQVEVVVHRQSVVHSLVEFADRSVLAQMGWPDMRLPIQHALFYPQRLANNLRPLDLVEAGTLTFEAPDDERFPCLGLAYEAARVGGSLPCALNAANEATVALFLAGRVRFPVIASLNAEVMRRHEVLTAPDIDQILEVDAWARAEVARLAV
ncbi:MAG: 1-deoxy-D-xylulose-5-phosphate reductoisomerase [Armatimonadetes bacterium]|nr:1-deoxy-D-xylulose-5-phosphate reductoisomerase [Armatimonadota bacterium]